jgi:putative transposase
MDRLLDEARSGPLFLKQTTVAQIVQDSILYGASLGHYVIHAWVIMSNHVHLLVTPHACVSRAMGSLKATTARRANLLLGRTGHAFWQDESYDRIVRSEDEFRRVQRYIENNPVKAGLVTSPEAYVWSSTWRPERPPQAMGLPHF